MSTIPSNWDLHATNWEACTCARNQAPERLKYQVCILWNALCKATTGVQYKRVVFCSAKVALCVDTVCVLLTMRCSACLSQHPTPPRSRKCTALCPSVGTCIPRCERKARRWRHPSFSGAVTAHSRAPGRDVNIQQTPGTVLVSFCFVGDRIAWQLLLGLLATGRCLDIALHGGPWPFSTCTASWICHRKHTVAFGE